MQMLPKAEELGLAAFAAAEDSKPIQTPYGSIQLAGNTAQQQFQSQGQGLGGMLVAGDSDEEEEEDDDDEDGQAKKRKRGGRASSSSAGSKNGKKDKGPSRLNSGTAVGEPDAATGRRKIRIEFIEDDSRRHITFSKRKAGIMKKAYELATLTGTQVLLLIVSQTGLVYTFTTPKLSPVVQQAAGRELIQSCLSAPEHGEEQNDDSERLPPSRGSRSDPGVGETHGAQSLPRAETSGAANNAHSRNMGQHSDSDQHSSYTPFNDPRMMGVNNVNGYSLNVPQHMPMLNSYNYGHPALVGNEHAVPFGAYGGM